MKACLHCGQPVLAQSKNASAAQPDYCCAACEHVARFIEQNRLQQFYALRDAQVTVKPLLDPHATRPASFAAFNRLERGPTALFSPQIHCGACAWLIENQLGKLDAALQPRVNVANKRIDIDLRESNVSLADVMYALTCLGYDSGLYQQEAIEQSIEREHRAALKRLALAGLGTMQIMMLSTGLYVGGDSVADSYRIFFNVVNFLLCIPVVFYAGWPFLSRAAVALRYRSITMDVPIALAIAAAFSGSAWNLLVSGGNAHTYFDSVAMFIFFLLLSRQLEFAARRKALLSSLQSQRRLAIPVRLADSDTYSPRELLKPGDRIQLAFEQAAPCDCVLLSPSAAFDESIITGESAPVRHVRGDSVRSGSIALDGNLLLEVAHTWHDSFEQQLQHIAEEARAATSHDDAQARLATRFSMMVIACAMLGFLLNSDDGFNAALWTAVSVLVVACPCALSISRPMVLSRGAHALSGMQIALTRPEALLDLPGIEHIYLDKTGTLTEPRLQVRSVHSDYSAMQAIAIAAALERQHPHPLAAAVRSLASAALPPSELTASEPEAVIDHPQAGVSATWQGQSWYFGNHRLLAGIHPDHAANSDALYLFTARAIVAEFHVEDHLKDGAIDLVRHLQHGGRQCVLLSGDREARVRRIASELGIVHYRGDLLPTDKQTVLQQSRAEGHRVAMIGDGSNDAVTMASADVSIAVGAHSPLGIRFADIISFNDSPQQVLRLFKLASIAQTRYRQNILWALIYNVSAIPLAMAGWVPAWLAAIGMSASALLVTLNAMRIRDA